MHDVASAVCVDAGCMTYASWSVMSDAIITGKRCRVEALKEQRSV